MEKKPVNKKLSETKATESKREPSIHDEWDYTEFEANKLKLSKDLKDIMSEEDLEWRFINKSQFVSSGNMHKGAWKPYNVKSKSVVKSFSGVDPEGIITRGDLILAVRPKSIGAKFKQRLAEKNSRYAAYNKAQAEELRQLAKQHGIQGEVTVHEGYDDN